MRTTRISEKNMREKRKKLGKFGWKSRFVKLMGIMTICFNVLSTPLTAIGIATMVVTTVALVVSCDKYEQNEEQPTETQKKHNVELVYDVPENISMDTLYKYNADPTVDSILLVLQESNRFSTLNTTQLRDFVVPLLRERHNVNPNKVFGKGEMELRSSSTINNPEIVRFMRDTMGYNVTYNAFKKSK